MDRNRNVMIRNIYSSWLWWNKWCIH